MWHLIKLIKRIFCKHKKGEFIRNIYGDEIIFNTPNYSRSVWSCEKCDGVFYSKELNNFEEPN